MSGSAPDVGVVVVAAGSGSRTGSPQLKQFRWVAGKPMLLHSVQTFQARTDVAVVVCVLPRSHAADPPPWLFQGDLERLMITVGGRTRTESVVNGLQELPDDARIVLVHDAARPVLPEEVLERVLAPLSEGWDGVVPALPLADTVKRVEGERVVETLARGDLVAAQTPQAFLAQQLQAAVAAGGDATDCAALVEARGGRVKVVPGDPRLLKVTTPGDLETVSRFV